MRTRVFICVGVLAFLGLVTAAVSFLRSSLRDWEEGSCYWTVKDYLATYQEINGSYPESIDHMWADINADPKDFGALVDESDHGRLLKKFHPALLIEVNQPKHFKGTLFLHGPSQRTFEIELIP